jgi:hypothetical protein
LIHQKESLVHHPLEKKDIFTSAKSKTAEARSMAQGKSSKFSDTETMSSASWTDCSAILVASQSSTDEENDGNMKLKRTSISGNSVKKEYKPKNQPKFTTFS